MKSTGYVFKSRDYIGSATPPDTLEDESRFGNDGTHTDITDVQLPSGLWVCRFNGSSSRIGFGNVFNLGVSDFTISFWFKHSTAAQIFLSKFQGTNDRWYLYSSAGKVKFFARTTADAEISLVVGTTGAYDDKWHSATVVGDRGTRSYVYLDGKDDTDGTPGCTVSNADNTGNFNLGNYSTEDFAGDSAPLLKIFRYALSAGKIKQIFEKERHWFGI